MRIASPPEPLAPLAERLHCTPNGGPVKSRTPVACRESRGVHDLDLDLIPYTNIGANWIGRHSRFGVFWPFRELSGLQSVGAIIGNRLHVLGAGVLRWRVSHEGVEHAAGFPQRFYYPWAVVEECDFGPVGVRATMAFVGEDALLCRLELRGSGRVRVEFESPWEPGRPIPHLPRHPWPPHVYTPATEPVAQPVVERSAGVTKCAFDYEVYFFYGPPDYPGYKGMKKGDRAQSVWLADTEGWEGDLSPDAPVVLNRCVSFGFREQEAAGNLHEAKQQAARWDFEAERERTQTLYRAVSELPDSLADDPAMERLRRHAVVGLLGSVTRGRGGFWGNKRITLAARYQIVGQWYWDTAVAMLGLREFAPDIARESCLALLENQTEYGAGPLTLTDTTRHGEGQSPLLAWATWMLHRTAPDRGFLEMVYPMLRRNVEYWFGRRLSKNGLPMWSNAAQSADNDARFAPCGTTDLTGNVDVHSVESVDLSAFLVAKMRFLGNIAEALGRADEASEWRRRAEEHSAKMVERFYFADEAVFWDTHEDTGEPFTKALTPFAFLPLWAGTPLPEDEKRRIIEEHMLNPREFFGDYPFPSLAYNHPEYNPHSYWRGRIWPHVVYWMIEILWDHGYRTEAERTARRMLQIFRTTPYLHECYPSDGYDPHMGLPEYNWSCAICLELLLERYKEGRF